MKHWGIYYNIYEAIDEKKPKVISNYYYQMEGARFEDDYILSPRYDDIYIRVEKSGD